MKYRHTAYLYLLLVSLMWGAASPVVKHTLQWFNPWLFLTYRFAVSSMIAIPYLKYGKIPIPKKPSNRWLVVLTGFISAPLTLFLFFSALDKTTALSGSLISAVGPLLLILGGVMFFRDRITHQERLGIGVALLGTLYLVIAPLIGATPEEMFGRFEGNSLMLLATTADIAAALLAKEALKKGIHPTLLAQAQFIIGFLLFFPLLLISQSHISVWQTLATAPLEAHLGVLYMAVISGSIAYTMRTIAIKSIEVSESAIFSYLQPVWAAILAILWLGEVAEPSYIIGGAIIAVGVVLSEQKRGTKHAKKGIRRQKRRHLL